MEIFCQMQMTQIVLLNDDEWTTDIAFRFSSGRGNGYITGQLIIPHEAKPKFRYTIRNDFGLPVDVCRELLAAAYLAFGRITMDIAEDVSGAMPDFGKWLYNWYKPMDAIRLGWTVAHYLQQRPPSAMLPAPHPDSLGAQWQIAIIDNDERSAGGAKMMVVRLFSLPYAVAVGAWVADFEGSRSVVDEVFENDCLLPIPVARSVIQQIYEACRPEDGADLVTWINLTYFVETYFPDSAETIMSLLQRPIRTFCA